MPVTNRSRLTIPIVLVTISRDVKHFWILRKSPKNLVDFET